MVIKMVKICVILHDMEKMRRREYKVFNSYAEFGKYLCNMEYTWWIFVLDPMDMYDAIDVEKIRENCGECNVYIIINRYKADRW